YSLARQHCRYTLLGEKEISQFSVAALAAQLGELLGAYLPLHLYGKRGYGLSAGAVAWLPVRLVVTTLYTLVVTCWVKYKKKSGKSRLAIKVGQERKNKEREFNALSKPEKTHVRAEPRHRKEFVESIDSGPCEGDLLYTPSPF
ncbi:hypothetical protein BHE74_00001569, partial [Ensete ventricosum]